MDDIFQLSSQTERCISRNRGNVRSKQKRVTTVSNIHVSFAEIEHSAELLSQGREEISAKLQALQQQMQQLVTSGFITDQASKRFQESYIEYTSSANTVIAKLSEIQNFLKQTAAALRDMDQQIASRIG